MAERVYVSDEGMRRLREQLDRASAVLKAIRDEKAIAYTATGDTWHDNPYFNKLEQDEQAKIREIGEVQTLIASARMFTVPEVRNTERVQLGSIVRFRRVYQDTGEQQNEVWEIVGYGEIDIEQHKVAYNSPLAQALIGLEPGDTRQTNTPKGQANYEIVELYSSWEDVETNS